MVNPGVSGLKPLGGFKVDSSFHPSEDDQMSTKNSLGLSGKNVSSLWFCNLGIVELHKENKKRNFTRDRKFHNIFNRNSVRVCYSSTENISHIINSNKKAFSVQQAVTNFRHESQTSNEKRNK